MTVRTILFALSIACFSSTLSAQIRTGISVGAMQNHIKSDYLNQTDVGVNYQVGFEFWVPLSNRISIIPSVHYSPKSVDVESTFYLPEEGLAVGNYRYSYQTYQGQLSIGITPIKGVSLTFGAYLDAMSNSMDDYDPRQFIGDLTNSYEGQPIHTMFEAFSGIDYGPVIGLSMGTSKFRISAKYLQGIPNLYTYASPFNTDHFIKTQSFSIGAAYYFLR